MVAPSSSSSCGGKKKPLVTCELRRRKKGEDAGWPFETDAIRFSINAGETLWLKGPSGAGKTLSTLQMLDLHVIPGAENVTCWDESVPEPNRSGMLLQQGVLIDDLTVYDNIKLALKFDNLPHEPRDIQKYIEMVSLKYPQDARKFPEQLSGGMLRRATLAQMLAQRKALIVLDEPFVGLDSTTALCIANELRGLQEKQNTAFILISHQQQYAALLNVTQHYEIKQKRLVEHTQAHGAHNEAMEAESRIPFQVRTRRLLFDYFVKSLPLIMAAFVAAGFSLALLLAYVLENFTVKSTILDIVDKEFSNSPSPMLKMMASGLKSKVGEVVDAYEPSMKGLLFAQGLAKVFIIEIGPLITALLLAGRIGGSYAGNVATMRATNQTKMLRILNLDPTKWSFEPAIVSALVSFPVLTLLGTLTAIACAAVTGLLYEVVSWHDFWENVREAAFPSTTSYLAYPPFVLFYRSMSFLIVIMYTAEFCARRPQTVQLRRVSSIITNAVVIGSLLVIATDFVLGQILIRV